MQTKAHLKATNKWLAENRERITVIVKSGEKGKIKARAGSLGVSVNEYINKLIEQDMNKAGE